MCRINLKIKKSRSVGVNFPLAFRHILRIFVKARLKRYMYFDSFKDFPDARINPTLLWEYDLSRIDYESMRDLIVQRVIERGWPDDWYAMLNLYGIAGVKSAIKNIPYLNDKDMNFVSHQFNIPLSAMKCYKNKQSAPTHWNS